MLSAPTIAYSPTWEARSGRLSLAGRLFIATMLIMIVEGAARKWVSASLTLPLILVRDLLALGMTVHALRQGHLRQFPLLGHLLVLWTWCVVGWGLLQLTLGQSNPAVYLIGLRFWLLYIWFGVAAAASMTTDDFRIAWRVLLAVMVLSAPLAVLQHYSPPGAFINRTVDSEEEDIFVVIAGVVRTTGTFSFTAGFSIFLALCTPFVCGAMDADKHNLRQRLAVLLAFAGLAASCLVSGARGAILVTGGVLATYLVGSLLVSSARNKAIALLSVLGVSMALGMLAYLFQDAVQATQQRFQTASEAENLIERIFATLFGELWIYAEAGWLGQGLGLGSNLAQYVQTGGRAFFALSETEPGRILLEGGLLGWLFLVLKYMLLAVAWVHSLSLTLRQRAMFPLTVWITIALALIAWPTIGQLSANALFGVLLALGLLTLRYPTFRLFV